jgi:ABC-2 type transport system permease protein
MANWLTVFLYELRQQFQRKAYRFVTFGVPLIAIVMFFGYQLYQEATGEEDDQPVGTVTEQINEAMLIGYVDRTPEQRFPAPTSARYASDAGACRVKNGDTITAALIKQVSAPNCWRSSIKYYDSLEAGQAALEDGKIDALYVIEPDYIESGDVAQYMQGFSIEVAETENTFTGYLLASLLYEVDDAQMYELLFLRLRVPAVLTEHRVAETGVTKTQNDDQNFVLVYGFGLVMMLSLFWGGGYLMQSVAQEKESRIIEIMLSSVRPVPLLAGKILAMGLLSVLQVATLVGTFVFLGSQAGDIFATLGDLAIEPLRVGIMVVYFLLGFLFFGSLMAAIAAVSASLRESQQFVVVVTLPAAVPFFFLTLFAQEPNGTAATALSVAPVTAPLSMIMRLAVTDVPTGELLLSLGLMVLAVAFAIWIAGRLFRVNTLLMGSTPKLRDIPRLLWG